MLSIILGFVFFLFGCLVFFRVGCVWIPSDNSVCCLFPDRARDSCFCQHWITYVNTGSCLYCDPELDC